MFSNLIESGSHSRDLKRKSYFFLVTLAFYAVMLVAAGVGGIYAYDARLDAQNNQEIFWVLRFPPARAASPRRDEQRPAAAASNDRQRVATVVEVVRNAPVTPNRQAARPDTPVLPPGVRYEIGTFNNVPPAAAGSLEGEPGGALRASAGGHEPPRVEETEAAPIIPAPTPVVRAAPQPTPPAIERLPSSVLSGKAYHKPAPPYPELARAVHAAGPVAVQVLVDEQGRVISAEATGGHALLRQAAVRAAYQARFTPTLLSGRPVKVTGVITYNFVLQ